MAASTDLRGSYAIVTGGSKGIGLETVKGLMQHGMHVVIAARDEAAANIAMKQLSEQGLPGTCSFSCVDLESQASIRSFAAQQQRELKKRGQSLRTLVNNAGVMGVGYTSSGQDRHMLCNHLGPFLLTRLLEPSMVKNSRVVNVASRAHYQGRLKFDSAGNLIQQPKLWWWRYGDSKLANIVFTAELQRRWGGSNGITCVSVSPGLVSTQIFANMPWPLNHLTLPLLPLIGRTPEQGAQTTIWAATSPDVKGDTDHLFLHDCKPMKPLAAAQDVETGRLLWQWSERMCGLE